MPKFAFKIIAGIVGSLLLIEILFDPISVTDNFMQKSNTQRELEKAQQLWNAKGAVSYKINVRGAEPLTCLYDAIITVQDGEIAKVEASKDPFNEKSEYKIVEKENWNKRNVPVWGCNYTQFTIPQILAYVGDELKNTDPITQKPKITFDSDYGYVTHYEIKYHGYGLFTMVAISDCCSWYEFSGYEPIK